MYSVNILFCVCLFAYYQKLSGLVLMKNVVAFVFCYDKTDVEPVHNAVVLLQKTKFYVLVSLLPLQHQGFQEGRIAIYSVNYIS